MKSDENKINRPKNKTTGAVLGLRTAPVCGSRAGSRNSRRKRVKKKLRFCGVESLGKFLVLSGGVGVLAGLPVDVLEEESGAAMSKLTGGLGSGMPGMF